MLRLHVVLGVILLLGDAGVLLGQDVGSWRNSPPNSRRIVHDGKGRRLFWDDNGQVVGWYSFSKRKFESIAPAEETTASPEAATDQPPRRERNPARLAIVYRGVGHGRASIARETPKVVSGNYPTATIVRYERTPPLLGDVVSRPAPASASAVSISPMGTP